MSNNKRKINEFIFDANNFLGKGLTFEDSKFIAWNNAVIRFLEKNYGINSTTTKIFRERYYSPPIYYECSHKDFVDRFESDLKTSIEELKRLAIEANDEESTIKDENKNKDISSVDKVLHLINRFHLVARQLNDRHQSRKTLEINDEYDVQDLFHALLRIYFEDIRTEECCPSHAASCSRQDFLLKNENIVIEIKKTRKELTAKKIDEQLTIDITKYKTHPNCKTLICFVYDPEEIIKNPLGIENDLSSNENGLNVIVKIIQK